jgi:cytochrome c
MVRAVSGDSAAAASVSWLVPGDLGFALLRSRGSAARGAHWLHAYACGGCHVIPGIPMANGLAGPPLNGFAQRNYIAGELVNTPNNLVAWLVNPPAIEPGTAMPAVGLNAAQALDIAAYLYALPSH